MVEVCAGVIQASMASAQWLEWTDSGKQNALQWGIGDRTDWKKILNLTTHTHVALNASVTPVRVF